MDRIINVKVSGNYISKDNKVAGVQGEGNMTNLRITFDEGWDGYAKTVSFLDAKGGNPVRRLLTKERLENIKESTRVYLVPIPPEPMKEEGYLTFVIDGYKGEFEKDIEGDYILPQAVEGKRQRSISDTLEVKYAPIVEDAPEPSEPDATPLEEMQAQIESIMGDIQETVKAKDEAKEHAETAEESAEKAVASVGKTSYIGDNGNWFAWDGHKGEFYDTGVKAQAGSTVYVGDNPPDNADVWVNPNGGKDDAATKGEVEALRQEVLVLANKVAPTPASVTLYADRWEQKEGTTMWYQEVTVANAYTTSRSKVDLQLSAEQIAIFYEKDLAFVTENVNGKIYVYCIGRVPDNDYVIQATVSEVKVYG